MNNYFGSLALIFSNSKLRVHMALNQQNTQNYSLSIHITNSH